MKKIALLLLFIIPSLTYCQISKSAKMDQTTLEELKMTVYDKDSSAVAVVLYDQGNLYLYNNNLGEFRTDNYFRIKILKKDGFRKATIKIPFYDKQEIKNIEAITYNLSDGSIKKDKLKEENIFKTTVSGEWKEISFALPNVTVGSVIEYSYTLVNPYMLHIDDWYFQDDIPKIKSEDRKSVV